MQNNDCEALKLLIDWSKWMVSIQIALIAAIGFAIKTNLTRPFHYPIWRIYFSSSIFLVISIVCFTVSIIAASWFLFACPDVLPRLPSPPGKNVYTMDTYGGVGKILVVHFVDTQLLFL